MRLKVLMCQHVVTDLPEGGKRYTCNNCGLSFDRYPAPKSFHVVCKVPPRTICQHFGEEKFQEQCLTCGGTKMLGVHWCNKLNILCAPTSRLPYENCLLCSHWQPCDGATT